MQYINANDILPVELVVQIQQYISGGVIYVPSETKLEWGCKTDTKAMLAERNADIREKKQSGMTINELMEKYHLSYDSVKRIIYKK